LTNEALREANIETRVDHRTLKAQGIDREPRPRLPWAAVAAERKGERSGVAEHIRERHRQRVAVRKEKEAQKQVDNTTDRSSSAGGAPVEQGSRQEPNSSHDMDARRRQAVQNWLKYRANLEQAGREHEREASRPLSMDEIRRRAVEAWKRLHARGAESQPSAASGREHDAGRDRGEAEPARDTPGLGDE